MADANVPASRRAPLIETILTRLGMGRTLSLEALRAALDASPDCIKIIGPDGALLFMNENGLCAMEIADFSAVDAREWAGLWPEASQARIRTAVLDAMGGRETNFEAFCPTAAGTPRWWSVSVAPIPTDDGTVRGAISISRDVTALVEAKRRLDRRVERLVEEEKDEKDVARLRDWSLSRRVMSLVLDLVDREPAAATALAPIRQVAQAWLASEGDDSERLSLCRLLEASLLGQEDASGRTSEPKPPLTELAIAANAATA